MFIKLSASGDATLEDPDNFKAFKVVAETTAPLKAAGLAGVGRAEGDHVWIDPAWLRANGRADDAAWLANLQKMMDYAKGAGWVDESGAIRAHVEKA